MVRCLTIAEIRAQIPQAVRQSFAPGNQFLTDEQKAKVSERTPLERELAKVKPSGTGW